MKPTVTTAGRLITEELNHSVLLSLGSAEELPTRINSSLVRYFAILGQECPELTASEWLSIIDILNSTCRETDNSDIDIANYLYSEIEEGNAYEGLGKKWDIDVEDLVTRLHNFSYVQQCAIVHVVNRYWDGTAFKVFKSVLEQLESCGAKIKE